MLTFPANWMLGSADELRSLERRPDDQPVVAIVSVDAYEDRMLNRLVDLPPAKHTAGEQTASLGVMADVASWCAHCSEE